MIFFRHKDANLVSTMNLTCNARWPLYVMYFDSDSIERIVIANIFPRMYH